MQKWITYDKMTRRIVGVYYSSQEPDQEAPTIESLKIPDNVKFTSEDNVAVLMSRIKLENNKQLNQQGAQDITWETF